MSVVHMVCQVCTSVEHGQGFGGVAPTIYPQLGSFGPLICVSSVGDEVAVVQSQSAVDWMNQDLHPGVQDSDNPRPESCCVWG